MSPEKVGRYRIKSEVARGGMATVYRAYDPSFDREVAVKVLPRELMHNLILRARFKRELKLIASLEHPAIVPVYDVGEDDDGRQFFVMRYMAGGSLSDWLKRGAISLQDTAIIIERLASGLDYAHQKGIVHRDIKPDNVLFDGHNHPYLTDFGIAKITEGAISATGSGAMGTPAYVSPEQAQGGKVDGRTDVYGMGVMIYEMLTGVKPYDADSPMSVAVRHITEPIPEILQAKPELPAGVDTIIKTAMAKDKEERYSTAIDLAHALGREAFGEDRTIPSTPSPIGRQRPTDSSRRRYSLMLMGVVFLIALAGVFALSMQSSPPVTETATPTIETMVSPTFTPAAPTATITATSTQGMATLPPPPGNADKIAFLSGNDLYLMNLDGGELIQVRTDNSPKLNPQWLADGRLVYMSRNCVFILEAVNSQPRQVMCFDANETLEGFRVSPDGKLAAISIQRTLNILPFDLQAFEKVDSRFDLLAFKDNCFYNQFPFREALWSKDAKQIAARVVDTRLVNSDQVFLLSLDIPNCATAGPVRLDTIPGGHIEFESDSMKRVTSFDWDGGSLFLLNDSVRNEGFGNLYLYNGKTKEATKVNPISGLCCYRDARWSPDGAYILFVFQRFDGNAVELYYIAYSDLQSGKTFTPIAIPAELLTQRDKPQPALRPAQ